VPSGKKLEFTVIDADLAKLTTEDQVKGYEAMTFAEHPSLTEKQQGAIKKKFGARIMAIRAGNVPAF